MKERRKYEPIEQVRCHGCGSVDVLPMPVRTLTDRLWQLFAKAPFKCRKCRKKLYRRVRKKS